MNVRYRVELSQAERSELNAMLSKGKRAARKLKRAQILLAADAGRGDEEIARTVAVSGSTVYRTKRRFVEGNLERALNEELRPGAERKVTGKEEALVETACGPEGRARWTLELWLGRWSSRSTRACGRKWLRGLMDELSGRQPGWRTCSISIRSTRSRSAGGLLDESPVQLSARCVN